jgi:hypothetical protein
MANDKEPPAARSPWGCVTGLAVLMTGTLVGGLTTWKMAMSQPWFKAGLPVAVSKVGEMIFLAVGCLAGLACVAVLYSMFCLFLDGRGTLRRWQNGARAVLLVLLAALVGLAAAAGASAVLKFVVATMPDEGLDVLTDEIPQDEPLLDDEG